MKLQYFPSNRLGRFTQAFRFREVPLIFSGHLLPLKSILQLFLYLNFYRKYEMKYRNNEN